MRKSAEISGLIAADQARLGPLRFSPLRTWFAVLTQRLAKLEGVASGDLDVVLDLGAFPRGSIDHVGDWAWLSQLVDSVRGQLVDEERATADERPLSECWIGRGWLKASGLGPVGRRAVLIRFVNAADARDQIVVQESWWCGPSAGCAAVPVGAIVRTADPARVGHRVTRLLARRPPPVGASRWLLEEVIQLAAADKGIGSTPERLGGLVHLSHGAVRAAEPDQILFGRLPRRLPMAVERRRRVRSKQVVVVSWRPNGASDAPTHPHASPRSGPGEGGGR